MHDAGCTMHDARTDHDSRRSERHGADGGIGRRCCLTLMSCIVHRALRASEKGARAYGVQSATNTFVFPSCAAWRLLAKTSILPSGENMGKPSNVGLFVLRSRLVPSTSMAQSSKSRPRGLWWLDEKMIRLPSGYQYGAKLAACSEVT